MHEDEPRFAVVDRLEWRAGEVVESADAVAREAPLSIQVDGVPVSVLMRTPGADEVLALGLLLSEGVIEGIADIVSIRHCDRVEGPGAEDSVLQVRLARDRRAEVERMRRTGLTGSSCGVCGRASVDDLYEDLPSLAGRTAGVTPATLHGIATRLRASQPTFKRTGGVHAAGLFTSAGEALAVFEDVGRHNAVDKVIGWAQREACTRGTVLMVSGRVSFEIVQKALRAKIPVISAVSAPTSMAVELARACEATLACFVRDTRLCVYSGGQRLGLGASS